MEGASNLFLYSDGLFLGVLHTATCPFEGKISEIFHFFPMEIRFRASIIMDGVDFCSRRHEPFTQGEQS